MLKISKGYKEALGGEGYVHYLPCDDGIMSVSICPNPLKYIC